MDRAMLEQHLAQTEDHITLGQHHIARQRELIAGLDRDGYDATGARRLLATFEKTQETHYARRHTILNELARKS